MTFMTNEERMQRESNLIATIRKKLPDFARMCADDAEQVLLHQDAFAADYQEDEYMLLGIFPRPSESRNRPSSSLYNAALFRSTGVTSPLHSLTHREGF
jgi:hypothetical protein